jgi:hypothetical protein
MKCVLRCALRERQRRGGGLFAASVTPAGLRCKLNGPSIRARMSMLASWDVPRNR